MQKCIASTYGGLSHMKRNENTKRVHMVCVSVRVCSVQWTQWASPWPGGWLRVHVDVSCWGAGSWEYWVLCLDLGCWLAFCERVLVTSSQVLQIIWDPKSLPVAEALGLQIKGIRQEVTCDSTAMQKGPWARGNEPLRALTPGQWAGEGAWPERTAIPAAQQHNIAAAVIIHKKVPEFVTALYNFQKEGTETQRGSSLHSAF